MQNRINLNNSDALSDRIERTCSLSSLSQHEIRNDHILNNYPKIHLKIDATHNNLSSVGATLCSSNTEPLLSVLIPVNEGVLKRIMRTYFEIGFTEALNVAREANLESDTSLNAWLSSIAEYILGGINMYEQLKMKIFPYMKRQTAEHISMHVETRDWITAPVRCIAWHPNWFKLAVAGSDDGVRIYTDCNHPSQPLILKSPLQKAITSMAWRPFSGGDLAIGCQAGVCIWTIDDMHITRPITQDTILKHPNNTAVTSIGWKPDGTFLVSASIGGTEIIIWHVEKAKKCILKRFGPPSALIQWSPNGAYLFASTVGSIFRVWSTCNAWEAERWSVARGYVQSACWSPCGSFLLFVTSVESMLYRLQFHEEQVFQVSCDWRATADSSPKMALPVADLRKITIDNRQLGGQPQSLAWDPFGRNLAITFKDTSCIVVFSTSVQKFNLTIAPTFFIAGINEEYPTYVCFQSKACLRDISMLAIGWSSGRIQYFPLHSM